MPNKNDMDGKKKLRLSSKMLSVFVVWSMVFSVLLGLIIVRTAEGGSEGDWVITDDQEITGDRSQDGNITIENGGTLKIVDSELLFLQDTSHIYHMTVKNGGKLILDNSIISVELDLILDYLKFNLTVEGSMEMTNNSVLKFPGNFVVDGGDFVMKDSTITGLEGSLITNFCINANLPADDNDDAPIMKFNSSTVNIYDSRIEKLYEYTSLSGPHPKYNITLSGNTNLTVINSYIGIDFIPTNTMHNVLNAEDNSIAYLYNMTIDESQNPANWGEAWKRVPAILPTGPTFTFEATPQDKDPLDNTGEPIGDLLLEDNTFYTVSNLGSGQNIIYIDNFTIPSPPEHTILSVVLRVAYNTLGTPAETYVGNNYIQWALEGSSLTDTTIRPIHTNYAGDPVNEHDQFDLYTQGVDTFNKISTLDVSYINDNATTGVRIDRLWIEVTYTLEAKSQAYIYRWLDLDVNDAAGIPVGGAEVTAHHTPSGDPAEYYVPSGIIQYVPPTEVLDYLGKSAGDYDLTDSSGKAFFPLLTEWINASTYPNSYFVGNYELTTTYLTLSDTSYISFEQYPAIKKEDNTYYGEVEFTDVAEPSSIYSGDTWYIIGDEIINGITYTWNGNVQINSTGNLTIRDGALYIAQGGTKHFINVLGSLILESGSIESDSPLNIYLASNAGLTLTLDSDVLLNEGGEGNLIASDSSTITMSDSMLDANLYSDCSKVSLYYSTLGGSKVYIKSASESEIYNCDLSAVDELNLESDFDIRNIDFSLPLEFDGDQQIQLTNVTYPSLKVSDNAKVFEYWWLTVKTIDGAGSLLGSSRGANVTVVIERNIHGLPQYTHTSTNDTDGVIIHRVLSREITHSGNLSRNSYSVTGNCTYPYPGGLTYYPDSNVSVVVNHNVEVSLIFSELTPDFSVSVIAFFGENILEHESNQQPDDKELEIRATVHNAGNIDIDDVDVWIYRVEVNPAYPLSIYEQYKIGSESISMPRLGDRIVTIQWIPTSPGATTISVLIDPLNKIQESDENNNILYNTNLIIFSWPDLRVSDEITFSPELITDGKSTLVSAKVYNDGTVAASDVNVSFYDGTVSESTFIGSDVMDISGGGEGTAAVYWTPSQAGEHTIIVVARSANNSYYNCDYDHSDNRGYMTTRVLTKPDLTVLSQDYSSFEVAEGETFTIEVKVYNLGETSAKVNLSLYDGSVVIGSAIDLLIEAEDNISISVDCKGVHGAYAHTLIIVVDPENEIDEINEENNAVNVIFNVRSITGIVYLESPNDQDKFTVGALPIYASGTVRTDDYVGIAGSNITVILYEDINGNEIYDAEDRIVSSNTTGPTTAQGFFVLSLNVPSSAGEYRVVAHSTNMPTLDTTDIEITVETPLSWWEQPFLGISLWTWIIIIILVLTAIIAVSIYLKFYGLGKMVECGACGAFIPEGTKKCPKCGVEFETETAKCSECGAWIPVDAKKCPSCGVAFVAGKKEVEDYAKKMKLQYEDIVDKFRQEAKNELGDAFTEEEFQLWWEKQPTYVPFDKWLEEEEDKKKKGAVPCPVCRTLNSVNATICHKCGTLLVREMKNEEKAKPEEVGIPEPREEKRFKTVVKKPKEVIVKKRVIRRPKEE